MMGCERISDGLRLKGPPDKIFKLMEGENITEFDGTNPKVSLITFNLI